MSDATFYYDTGIVTFTVRRNLFDDPGLVTLAPKPKPFVFYVIFV